MRTHLPAIGRSVGVRAKSTRNIDQRRPRVVRACGVGWLGLHQGLSIRIRTARILATATVSVIVVACQPQGPTRADREAALRGVLERFHAESRFPGGVAGAWFSEDSSVVVAPVGFVDRERQTAMPPSARLHAGSVGKMLYAALALQLVGEGRIALDDKVSKYLGDQPWYGTLPNAPDITVRMLLDHSSGFPEYGYEFMVDLIENPGRPRTPLDAVKSVAGAKAKSAPGEKFSYSDVNYQVLQLLAERVTGAPAEAEINRRFVRPLALTSFVPATTTRIPGLVQGYAGSDNFMRFDLVMKDSALILHPAFEGGGGGYVTNAGDLARFAALFAEGKIVPASLLPEMRRGIPAGQLDVGANAESGLGVEMAPTPLGKAYGHGGFFPGYLSAVLWYPERGVAVAIQVNSSAKDALARPLREFLLEAARALTDTAGGKR